TSGGAKSVAKTDLSALAGKNLIIWPDADIAGAGYAADIRKIVESLSPPARVKIIDPADLDLKDGEDVVDFVQQLKNAGKDEIEIKKNLIEVFSRAKSTGPASDLQVMFADIGAGRMRPLETGFPVLDDLLQIYPGSLTNACGPSGSRKSLWMLQLARKWHAAGIKVAIYELEKTVGIHLRRALAQETGTASLTRNSWVEKNFAVASKLIADNFEFSESFGRCLFASPNKMVYQNDVIEWAQKRVDAGCIALIIDPATIAERNSEPWKADQEFVGNLQRIATLNKVSIFLVLHPSKVVVTLPDLALISGGKAYGCFCDNAVWIENHNRKKSTIKFCTGSQEENHDATLHILKSRDGAGTGARIALDFNEHNLTLHELGRITKKE
ncbi:MAG: hypothetical protein Q7T18_02150, partial [Sedimentisphaerales bacterium]|nr:hypothetical protein [Sedimentisphaerales bacterium]